MGLGHRGQKRNILKPSTSHAIITKETVYIFIKNNLLNLVKGQSNQKKHSPRERELEQAASANEVSLSHGWIFFKVSHIGRRRH